MDLSAGAMNDRLARVVRVRDSYRRCRQARGFFTRFYRRLMGADPRIAALFDTVDMERQYRAFRHGLNVAVMYAEGKPVGEMGMRRICEIHRTFGGALTAELYALWIESLVHTLAEVDPLFNAELERDWRETLSEAVIHLLQPDQGTSTSAGEADRW
jgi:hemoglobin-like flavoprotein